MRGNYFLKKVASPAPPLQRLLVARRPVRSWGWAHQCVLPDRGEGRRRDRDGGLSELVHGVVARMCYRGRCAATRLCARERGSGRRDETRHRRWAIDSKRRTGVGRGRGRLSWATRFLQKAGSPHPSGKNFQSGGGGGSLTGEDGGRPRHLPTPTGTVWPAGVVVWRRVRVEFGRDKGVSAAADNIEA